MPYYVKVDDILAFIPTTDTCGPKPSFIRKKLDEMPKIYIEENIDEEDDTK